MGCQPMMEVMEPFICPEDSQMVSQSESRSNMSGRSRGQGTYYDFTCVYPDGSVAKSATDAVGNAIFSIVILALIIPVGLLILNSKFSVKKEQDSGSKHIQMTKSSIASDNSLTQKLTDLKKARGDNLISEEEFQKKRQDILDKFS